MDPAQLAAAGDHGCDAAVLLDLGGALVSLALASQSSDEPRRHDRAGAGKGL